MDSFASVGPASPTGDFSYGKRFDIFQDLPNERYVVADEADRAVAFLPSGIGGVIRTRTASWKIVVERGRVTWALVAYDVDGAEVGGATQKLVPNTYKLWLGPGELLHLTKNPISRRWKLRAGHRGRLARFYVQEVYGPSRNISSTLPWMNVGWLETADYTLDTKDLALPIVLALEMIKAEMAIDVPGPDLVIPQ